MEKQSNSDGRDTLRYKSAESIIELLREHGPIDLAEPNLRLSMCYRRLQDVIDDGLDVGSYLHYVRVMRIEPADDESFLLKYAPLKIRGSKVPAEALERTSMVVKKEETDEIPWIAGIYMDLLKRHAELRILLSAGKPTAEAIYAIFADEGKE